MQRNVERAKCAAAESDSVLVFFGFVFLALFFFVFFLSIFCLGVQRQRSVGQLIYLKGMFPYHKESVLLVPTDRVTVSQSDQPPQPSHDPSLPTHVLF